MVFGGVYVYVCLCGCVCGDTNVGFHKERSFHLKKA